MHFPLQTVIAPHECPPGFVGLPDDTCISAEFCASIGPDGHCIEVIPPTPEPECITEHWDKIIFQILRDPSGILDKALQKTELDIKVLDDPEKIADIKEKVRVFLKNDPDIVPQGGNPFDLLTGPDVDNLVLEIIDVEYAIVCIEFVDVMLPNGS